MDYSEVKKMKPLENSIIKVRNETSELDCVGLMQLNSRISIRED